MQIEMTIKGLMLDPVTTMPILILRDENGQRMLPIWIGPNEAQAIASQIENDAPQRPMTHDLLRDVIQTLDGTVQKVVVCDLQGQHVLRADSPAGAGRSGDRGCPAQRRHCAGAAHPGADLRRGIRHRQRQELSTPRPIAPTPSGCRSGWKASTPTTSANTRCDPPAGFRPRRLRSFVSSFANLCNHACRPS